MKFVICWILGHKPGWIPAWVPNPHSVKSEEWGCLRCKAPLRGDQ